MFQSYLFLSASKIEPFKKLNVIINKLNYITKTQMENCTFSEKVKQIETEHRKERGSNHPEGSMKLDKMVELYEENEK